MWEGNNLHEKKKKIFTKKRGVIFSLLLLLFWGWYFTYANLNTDTSWTTDYYYFPEGYPSDGSIHLSMTASGPNNSLDYYPWGYWVFVKSVDGKRKLSQFEIKKPAIHSDESFSSASVCDENKLPANCYTINYKFIWTDVTTGYRVESDIEGYKYQSTGYVDLMPDILLNAKVKVDWDSISAQELWITEVSIPYSHDENFLVKIYFWDDEFQTWESNYKDVSKKFVFRTKKDESTYVGIGHSDKDLWTWDSISPENLWEANFATVHFKANSHGYVNYHARVDPGDDEVQFITLDMDNIKIDSRSTPELHSYIEVFLLQINPETWRLDVINKNGEFGIQEPIYRISPLVNWYTAPNGLQVPATDTAKTNHLVGPSGSFRCPTWITIGSLNFKNDCYDQEWGFDGITQYTLNFTPDPNNPSILGFHLHNASTYAWNAFAIAGDVDIFGSDVPLDTVITDINNLNWVQWITSVEVDKPNTTDGENGFDDDKKETKISYIHTYKTEVCNNTQDEVNNVSVLLNKPIKSDLIDYEQTDVSTSSLMVWGTALDETIDDSKRISLSTFWGNINLWNLWVWECKYISYQVKVKNTITQWDVLSVKNQFSYDGWNYEDTNEVSNFVLAQEYDANLELTSEPVSWSDIYNGDYITYKLNVVNTGLTDIPSWKVVCPRFLDNSQTECKVGNCTNEFTFTDLIAWADLEAWYAVQTTQNNNVWDIITEQCNLEFDTGSGSVESKDSNEVYHNIIDRSTPVYGWDFSLELYSRPKLLNTADWNPRPDGADTSPIEYTYNYTWNNHEYMYPDLSMEGSYTDSRWSCSSKTWPNRPNAITYVVNTTNTSPKSSASFSSNNIDFSLTTTLPSDKPTTILHHGTLTPTHYVPWSEANNWFKNWGTKVLPLSATHHRAMVNGTDGEINSTITGTPVLDKWKYVPYATDRCSYTRCSGSWENRKCRTRTRSYTLYRWEHQTREDIPFSASNYRYVTVWGSTAWLKTQNSHVHTNDLLTDDGTSANEYNLWEWGYTNVKSSPKLYAPDGSYHWDYMVSTSTPTSSLKSKKGWYIYDKVVPKWHGYVYDREVNARNFYTDLLEKQKYWEVIEEDEGNLQNPLTEINWELNKIYYYPGDLTIEDSDGQVDIFGQKSTIVVWWNLYINSDMKYRKDTQSDIKRLAYLGVIVKWNVYINWDVEFTSGTFHVDNTVHTWDSVYVLRHLWSFVAEEFNFQRKAPEHYERNVNDPSEWVYFDDMIYIATPPGFAELDEWVWSYKFNINQYTWEEVEW